MKVILPVKNVPFGLLITKINGTKSYLVRDRIEIYNEHGKKKEIFCDQNCRFLVSDGNVNVISGDTEVIWETSDSFLYDYLGKNLEYENQFKI